MTKNLRLLLQIGGVRLLKVGNHRFPLADAALEILSDRFAAPEAVANSSIKLARYAPEDELAMDLLVANSVLEFGTSLRAAGAETMQWARTRGVGPLA